MTTRSRMGGSRVASYRYRVRIEQRGEEGEWAVYGWVKHWVPGRIVSVVNHRPKAATFRELAAAKACAEEADADLVTCGMVIRVIVTDGRQDVWQSQPMAR